MTDEPRIRTRAQQVAAVVAVLFGLATLWAGGTVLAGRDPGYGVFRPLLIFNTIMGVAYVGAGVLAWRRAVAGRSVAAVVLALNLIVLGGVVYLYRTGSDVAVDSVGAMTLRSAVWAVLLLMLAWASRSPRDAA